MCAKRSSAGEDTTKKSESAIDTGFLMPKVPFSGEDHCHTVFVRGVNHFVVPDRTTGLDNRTGTALGGSDQPVGKREEGVGCDHGTREIKF